MSRTEPVRLLVETDIFDDVDDVVALAVAHALADQGLARLEAVCVNTRSRWGHQAVRVVNQRCGRAVPVGARLPLTDEVAVTDYARHLVERFGGDLVDPPAAVDVHRATLAAAPPASVVLVSLGFFGNLVDLLASPADEHSALSGEDLVADRVRETVVMGGRFPEGLEFNLEHDDPAAAATFARRWPGLVTWLGWDEGATVITARELSATGTDDDPVAVAVRRFCGAGAGRSSWDPMTVQVAVLGPGKHYGHSGPGWVEVAGDGRSTWREDAAGRHRLVLRRSSDEAVAASIDALLTAGARNR